MLDGFHCYNTLPTVTGWLEEECRTREALPRAAHLSPHFAGASVHTVGSLIGEWIAEAGSLSRVDRLADAARHVESCRPGAATRLPISSRGAATAKGSPGPP